MWAKPANTPPYLEWLFVDTISIVVRIDANRAEVVTEQLNNASERFFPYLTLKNPLNNRTQWYRLSIEEHRIADIFFTLRSGRNSSLRFEYSANNLGEAGRVTFREFLQNILGETWEDDMRNGQLNRIDLAFDAPRITMKDLLIVDIQGRKSAYVRGEGGEVETYYSPFDGTKPKNKQLIVYDKSQERSDNRTTRVHRTRYRVTRFEYRQKELRGYSLNTLTEKQARRGNPLEVYAVMAFDIIDSSDATTDEQRLFFDACRIRGRDNALSEIQDETKRAELESYYSNLRLHPPEFHLRRTTIWAGLQRALRYALPIEEGDE